MRTTFDIYAGLTMGLYNSLEVKGSSQIANTEDTVHTLFSSTEISSQTEDLHCHHRSTMNYPAATHNAAISYLQLTFGPSVE